MQLGMIGLGRMGANLVRRLMRDGHECVAYDVERGARRRLGGRGRHRRVLHRGVRRRSSSKPRAVWIMVPAAFVDDTIEKLVEHLEPGDIIIDGGNSYYRDDIDRAARLKPKGIHYVDVRHERRRVRPRPRLLPDDRRRGRRRRPPRPDLRAPSPPASTPRRARRAVPAIRRRRRTATSTAGPTAPGTS